MNRRHVRATRLTQAGRVLRVNPAPLPRWLSEANDGRDVLLNVTVQAASGRARLLGSKADRLLLQPATSETPAAELRQIVSLLARSLALSPVQVSVVGGASSTHKTVRLAGVSARQVLLALRRDGTGSKPLASPASTGT